MGAILVIVQALVAIPLMGSVIAWCVVFQFDQSSQQEIQQHYVFGLVVSIAVEFFLCKHWPIFNTADDDNNDNYDTETQSDDEDEDDDDDWLTAELKAFTANNDNAEGAPTSTTTPYTII